METYFADSIELLDFLTLGDQVSDTVEILSQIGATKGRGYDNLA